MTTTTELTWRLKDRLARSLDHAGLEVADMAAHLHTHPNTVRNYLAGRTRPNFATLKLWADRTDVDIRWFLTGEEGDAILKGVNLQEAREFAGQIPLFPVDLQFAA